MQQPEAQRIDFIHMLRGLAAAAVACFHLYGHSHEPSAALRAVRTFSEYGWLGVPVFFVISGFVIAHSLRDATVTLRYAGNYALRRSARLDPPYWTVIAIAVLLQAGISILTHEPIKLPSWNIVLAHVVYMQNLLGLPNLSLGLWTLCLEVQFYIFFLALLAFSQRARIPLPLLVIALGAGSMCFSLSGNDDTTEVALNAYRSLIPNFSMFAIGIAGWMLYMRRISLGTWLFVQALVVGRLVVWYQAELFAALLAGIFITMHVTGRLRIPTTRPLLFLGTVSYSLYLIHPAAGRILLLGIRKLTGIAAYDSLGWTTLGVAFSVLAAYVMYRLVERPSIRLSKWLKPAASGFAPAQAHTTGLAPIASES